MTDFLDEFETRDPERREADLLARLPALVARAQQASGWSRLLADIPADDINTRAALQGLPLTRKADLKQLQADALPFGGLTTVPTASLGRVFMSPGPIYDPEGKSADWWRSARALHAAGIRRGDLIQNCFAYHFTPAAFMIEGGAFKLGCPVIPAGTGQTEMQVQAMSSLRPSAYCGTPSFLKIIIEKARDMGADISSVERALVSAEALPPSLRNWLQSNGVPVVLQMYASADLGTIAYESMHQGQVNPGMILEEDLLLEIVRPGTGDPVPDGEVGEVVVTSFNPEYPLIRFATGDLSAVLQGLSPCGRSNVRLRGWLGRADQTIKVRAMFVHPQQVAEVSRRFPQLQRTRLVVTGEMGNDEMTLHCEVEQPEAMASQTQAIVDAIRDVTKLRGQVVFTAPGTLANDGKVIEDLRKYD